MACLAITGIYAGLIVLTLPVIYLTIALGFALSKAYVDTPELSFVFGFPFIWLGMLLGAIISFLISRYLFGKMIK